MKNIGFCHECDKQVTTNGNLAFCHLCNGSFIEIFELNEPQAKSELIRSNAGASICRQTSSANIAVTPFTSLTKSANAPIELPLKNNLRNITNNFEIVINNRCNNSACKIKLENDDKENECNTGFLTKKYKIQEEDIVNIFFVISNFFLFQFQLILIYLDLLNLF